MGITPITNLMPLSVARAIESNVEPLARVENSARTNDETYSPSNQKSSRGSEDDTSADDASEDEFEELSGEDKAESPRPSTNDPSRQLSFFA
jgi:hypothetical protein